MSPYCRQPHTSSIVPAISTKEKNRPKCLWSNGIWLLSSFYWSKKFIETRLSAFVCSHSLLYAKESMQDIDNFLMTLEVSPDPTPYR